MYFGIHLDHNTIDGRFDVFDNLSCHVILHSVLLIIRRSFLEENEGDIFSFTDKKTHIKVCKIY